MEKRTKNRLVLLGILAAAGILAIGAGAAMGAEGMFSSTQKDIKAVMNGSQVRIYEDDREIHNFTLPEGQNQTNYTWEISRDGDEIEIHLAHDEEESDDSHGSELNETERESELNETERESELNETERESELNETDHESELETHGENESLNETEDSHGQEANWTSEGGLETHGDEANGTLEDESELHESAGNSTQESGLNEENQTGTEDSHELSLQINETQGSEAED